MAEIGIVVPVYRVEEYLDRCVESILAQTFRDFDLILVDDGSPDNCGTMCDSWAEKDTRIRVIHQENAGLSAARNTGIEWLFAKSDCTWITCIDSDDWIHPEMLKTLLDAARELNVCVSVCGYEETDGREVHFAPKLLQAERQDAAGFYQNHFINATIACAKLYRKECFEGTRYPVGKLHEDEFVTYRILFENRELAFVPAPLYSYFINPAGITKIWSPKRLDAWEAYEQQLEFFAKKGMPELVTFCYERYLENGMVNLHAAEEDPRKYAQEIRFMEKRMRSVIRRAWKAGVIDFWMDFDMLYRFYPVLTKVYRLYLEWKEK